MLYQSEDKMLSWRRCGFESSVLTNYQAVHSPKCFANYNKSQSNVSSDCWKRKSTFLALCFLYQDVKVLFI